LEGNRADEQRNNAVRRGASVSKLAPSDIDKLSELLSKELEIFEKVLKLTESQTQLLEKDDIEALNSSLENRQELIEKINGLHQESSTLMQSYVSSPANEKNAKIEDYRKRINCIIKICSEQSNENLNKIKEKTQEQTDKIEKQSAKRKGIGGYAQAVPNTPEMFDKKT
jgi:flagellar biosynthesis/type III secretory pathway chaperone